MGSETLNNKSELVQEAVNELIEMLLDVGDESDLHNGKSFSLLSL